MGSLESFGMVATPIGSVPKDDLMGWQTVILYMDPILKYYADPLVTDVMINRYDEIFIERANRREKIPESFGTEAALATFIRQLAVVLDQPFDSSYPLLHGSFPDMSRVCCTNRQITPQGCTVTLRKAPLLLLTLEQLIEYRALSSDMADYLRERIEEADNMMVSGNTGSGKTTILRAMAGCIDKDVRLVSAEDTQELHVKQQLPNSIALVAPKRKPGGMEISLDTLIETTLRQQPDRVWVGEIRDPKAAGAFLQVLNTGVKGCAATIHSNSCADTVRRLQLLNANAGHISFDLAGELVLGSVQLFVHAERHMKFGRKITEIATVTDYKLTTLFRYNPAIGEHEYVAAKTFVGKGLK